jgi:hypothetical protein
MPLTAEQAMPEGFAGRFRVSFEDFAPKAAYWAAFATFANAGTLISAC